MHARFVYLVLGFATSASAAPAEETLDRAQLQLDSRREIVGEQTPRLEVLSTAYVQLTGGGDGGGGASAGAAAAVTGFGCDLLSASVHGRLRPFARDEHAGGEVDYGACLSHIGVTVDFQGSRASGIAPGLDARRSLWSRRYDATYHSAMFGLGEGPLEGRSRHAILLMTFGHGVTTQTDGIETRTIKTLDFEMIPYRYRNLGGLTLDTLVFTSNALKAGDSDLGGIGSEFLPVRARLELDDLFVAAQAGWGVSGGSVTESSQTMVDGKTTSSWTETVDSKGLPDMTIFVGKLEAGVRRDRVTASAAIGRSFYPTFDGNLAREARVSAELSYDAGKTRRTRLTLSPFATRTHTWTRDAGDSRDVGAGTSLLVGRELGKQLRFDAIGEAGVSPYARLDRDRLPSSTLGGQVIVALSARMDDPLRRLRGQ